MARDRGPDATTVWLYREKLAQAGLVEALFDAFDAHLKTLCATPLASLRAPSMLHLLMLIRTCSMAQTARPAQAPPPLKIKDLALLQFRFAVQGGACAIRGGRIRHLVPPQSD